MSAPIRGKVGQDNSNDVLRYAPPWAREHPLAVAAAEIKKSPPMVPEGGDPAEVKPLPQRFEDDMMFETLRRRRSLDPQAVPEPPIRLRRPRAPWLFGLLTMLALAAIGAFVVTWLTSSYVAAPGGTRSAQPLSATRLVVASQRGDVNRPLALGISLDGRASGETLLLAGFVEGTKLSAGSPLGRTGWHVPARDLNGVMTYAPRDFVGAMDAKAELRSASDRLMDSQIVRLEWVGKPPEEHAALNLRLRREAPTPAPLDAEEVAALLKRGHELFKTGDIASARLLLRRAAIAGSAPAALALGATFDAPFLAELGVLGFVHDENQARTWYGKAADLGSAEAARRLERLERAAK